MDEAKRLTRLACAEIFETDTSVRELDATRNGDLVARLQIQLGPHGMRFTQHSEAWEVLGSVQQGQAIGALVRFAAGSRARG
jgi:hypothetical protein